MIPIRRGAICTVMTLVLLNACTADASKDDDGLSVTGEASSPTTTSTSEPTYTDPSRPGHSPNSMTPREVVNAPDAELAIVALAPGDPDVRLSTWTALCHWCPDRPDGRGGSLGPPTFTGMALTTDGYETATYVRPRSPQLGYTVLSPRDDVFLLNDAANGREWLVDVDDGTEHRVARVDSELRPADPRLWFECGIARGDSSTWCSLDVDTATAYAWPEAWERLRRPSVRRRRAMGLGAAWLVPHQYRRDRGRSRQHRHLRRPGWHLRGLVGRRRQPAAPSVHHGRDGHRQWISARRAGLLDPAARLRQRSTCTPVASGGRSGSWRPARHQVSAGGSR